MSIVGLMVIYEPDSDEEEFTSIEIIHESGRIPENNSHDIMDIVEQCNNLNKESYTYVDMFGIIVDGTTIMWEVI